MADLAAALRKVLPRGVALGVGDAANALWPGEDLPNAVPARRAEFAAGRSAARDAMVQLGVAAKALPIGADRAPVWPDGLTGSISHCSGACMAVVGEAVEWAGIGLDVEPDQPLDPSLWDTILRTEERAFLLENQGVTANPGRQALKIFVAKEAVYKAQYSITKTLFGFDAIHIELNGNRFLARFIDEIGPFYTGFELTGQFVCAGNIVAGLVVIEHITRG